MRLEEAQIGCRDEQLGGFNNNQDTVVAESRLEAVEMELFRI